MTVGEIYNVIDLVAPFSSAMAFDNVGILVGSSQKEVKKALFALDITHAVVNEAVEIGADLIISHHPVIFDGIKNISEKDVVYRLIRHDMASIGCHTNLDFSPVCGVNIALVKRLGLTNVSGGEEISRDEIIFIGELEKEMSSLDFANHVKNSLNASQVKLSICDRKIKKVAVSSGGGASAMQLAENLGADAFVTGETRYHEEIGAANADMTVVVAGHYETESFFADELISYLQEKTQGIEFAVAKSCKPAMIYL